mgnify:CR=1 FL=1
MHALVTVRMIARSAQADRGIVMSNHANAVAFTFDAITRVIYWGHLANATLHRVSRVAHADVPPNSKCATSMLATIDSHTCIWRRDAIVAFCMVALVTYT